jgi:hypothetical protein
MTTTGRRSLLPAGIAVVVLLLAVGWLAVTAFLARSHLLDVRSEVNRLRNDVSDGRTGPLSPGLADIRNDAASAHRLTSDPVWWTAAHVPLLGRTFATTRGLTRAADDLAHNTLPQLAAAADQLDPAKVRRDDGSLVLSRLTAASPFLDRADSALAETRALVADLPRSGVLGPVASARRELDQQLGELAGTLDAAARAARVGPAMLGAQGPRRYLVMFQNPAEARGTGGLPGAFAVIRADNGRLSLELTGSDRDLQDAPTPVVDLGPEFNARWRAADVDRGWRGANSTPHYPWAAQIWQKLWERQTGQQIDGVIAVDPLALGYLLKVTGPIRLSDGEVLNGDNAPQWTLSTAYFKYPDSNERRKELLTELAEKAFDGFSGGNGGSAALLRALARSADEGRVLLWAARPAEQSVVLGTPIAGTVLDQEGPLAALILNNGAGNKLDYYVDRTLTYDVLRCGDGERTVRAEVTLKNNAPGGGLPNYVDVRSDGRPSTPGQSRTFVSYYATTGARITGATLDGKPVQIVNGVERGRPVFSADVEIRAGQSRTLLLEYTEPPTEAPVTVPVQPLARPMAVLSDGGCE